MPSALSASTVKQLQGAQQMWSRTFMGLFYHKAPLAEEIEGVVRRRDQAFHADGRVYSVGKGLEFGPVHVAAEELGEPVPDP
jgi:hypothetical protein